MDIVGAVTRVSCVRRQNFLHNRISLRFNQATIKRDALHPVRTMSRNCQKAILDCDLFWPRTNVVEQKRVQRNCDACVPVQLPFCYYIYQAANNEAHLRTTHIIPAVVVCLPYTAHNCYFEPSALAHTLVHVPYIPRTVTYCALLRTCWKFERKVQNFVFSYWRAKSLSLFSTHTHTIWHSVSSSSSSSPSSSSIGISFRC